MTTSLESIKRQLANANEFLGYGNRDTAELFFFGIEEASPFTELSTFDHPLRENERTTIVSKKVKGSTETWQSYLSYELLRLVLNKRLPSFEQYRNEMFGTKNEVCSNIFPLGSPAESDWPNAGITGYPKKHVFKKDCWNGTGLFDLGRARKEVLREFIAFLLARRTPRWIFVLGNKPRAMLATMIKNLTGAELTDSKFRGCRGGLISHSSDARVWFTPHPSHGHTSNQDADKIISYVMHHS
jgi:hypothetical protein